MNKWLMCLLTLLCSGCANIAPISGGPKDTSPPQLIYSTSKIDIYKKTILYEFDEKIQEMITCQVRDNYKKNDKNTIYFGAPRTSFSSILSN